jgi:glycerol-3-phosphate dehydrogenase
MVRDSRHILKTLFTASVENFTEGMKGCILGNYIEFKDFIKEDDKIIGAVLFDTLEKKEFNVKAKYVVNCTGNQVDNIKHKDSPTSKKSILHMKEANAVVDVELPLNKGIFIADTTDQKGFALVPFNGKTLLTTPMREIEDQEALSVTESDLNYLDVNAKLALGEEFNIREHLLQSWVAVKPELIIEPKVFIPHDERRSEIKNDKLRWLYLKFDSYFNKDEHDIYEKEFAMEVSDSGLYSLIGGSITTQRLQGQNAVDAIMKDIREKRLKVRTFRDETITPDL